VVGWGDGVKLIVYSAIIIKEESWKIDSIHHYPIVCQFHPCHHLVTTTCLHLI